MDGQTQAVGMANSTGAGPSGNWGGVSYLMPMVNVPYVNTMGQVNVSWPPSQDAYGKDLPLSADVNTLRYFFNLGVEYFGISAHIQQQQQQQQQQYSQYSYPTTPPQLAYAIQNGPAEYSIAVPNDFKGPTTIPGSHSPLAIDSSTPHTPREKPSPPPPSLRQMRQTYSSSSSSTSPEKESKDSMDLISDVSDSGFTSSGEGDGEQGREDDLDASIQQDPKLSDHDHDHDPGPGPGDDRVKVVKEKGKRKYYMYGTHKLIKPIKDIPPRFQQLLTDMKAAKERCHGQPIYMLEPLADQGALDQDSGGRLNAEAQCFYPRCLYNVCVTGNSGLYIHTSEASSTIHPPPMVPPPAFFSFGNQLPPPPSSLANNGGLSSAVAPITSMPTCLASSLPPPPPAPVYVQCPPAALDGKTPPSTSPVKNTPGAEANRRPAQCVPSPSRKAENACGASTLPGPSLGVGSSHALPAMSTTVLTVPPPKVLSTPGCCSVSSAVVENPRGHYCVYHSQPSFSTPGLQGVTHHTPTLPHGQLAYIVSPPTFEPPPSCLTYPPPVVGLPAHSTSVPCPQVAVQ